MNKNSINFQKLNKYTNDGNEIQLFIPTICLSLGALFILLYPMLKNLHINNTKLIMYGVPIFFSLIFISVLIIEYKKTPFKYPKIQIEIDISGRRGRNYPEYVEEWLIKKSGNPHILEQMYEKEINRWTKQCKTYLKKTWFWRKRKEKKFLMIQKKISVHKNDYKIFDFVFFRQQTRYEQQDYVRMPYKVNTVEEILSFSIKDLKKIDQELADIGYETTISKYNAKNQRKLMTKELRERIKLRDNYTCQICGKHMPDEVGLHIDHIVPIKEGGKSIESNLQVLCDKCNLNKGSKI